MHETMYTPRSKTSTIIFALNILGETIQSQDGVANAAILEAAARMEEMSDMLKHANVLMDSFFDDNVSNKITVKEWKEKFKELSQ